MDIIVYNVGRGMGDQLPACLPACCRPCGYLRQPNQLSISPLVKEQFSEMQIQETLAGPAGTAVLNKSHLGLIQ